MTEPCNTSGRLTSDTAIAGRPCILYSVIMEGDGTNAASVILYDNASAASGTAVAKVLVDAGLVYEVFASDVGILCNNGLYMDITGTGAACIVHYRLI